MRTAKSCGSGAAVLALRPREAALLRDNGGKRAVLRGEHEVSRKAIAQGRPECFALPCMLVCRFVSANRTRDLGCSKHPVFPAPSDQEGGKFLKARTQCAARSRTSVFVGWVERSDTHRRTHTGIDGYRCAPPILRSCGA